MNITYFTKQQTIYERQCLWLYGFDRLQEFTLTLEHCCSKYAMFLSGRCEPSSCTGVM